MATKSTKADIASELDQEAARLAGVSEILQHIGESTEIANSLGVLRDTVTDVNEKISDAAMRLRG